ncbi:MAG: ribonuclease H, partial [Candidatus Izemoplasmatales bacterium]
MNKEKHKTNFKIYTDGSCRSNPGCGGYAYTIYDEMGGVWVKSSGCQIDTTNNRMELTAAIEALNAIDKFYPEKKTESVTIYSDSAYLVNCFNEKWIEKWMANGWKTYDKKDVINKDLWQILN